MCRRINAFSNRSRNPVGKCVFVYERAQSDYSPLPGRVPVR
jgi:hypothetical protein